MRAPQTLLLQSSLKKLLPKAFMTPTPQENWRHWVIPSAPVPTSGCKTAWAKTSAHNLLPLPGTRHSLPSSMSLERSTTRTAKYQDKRSHQVSTCLILLGRTSTSAALLMFAIRMNVVMQCWVSISVERTGRPSVTTSCRPTPLQQRSQVRFLTANQSVAQSAVQSRMVPAEATA